MKHSYYVVTLPGGDDHYVFFHHPIEPEEVRRQYAYQQATAIVPVDKMAWMADSGRRHGVGPA